MDRFWRLVYWVKSIVKLLQRYMLVHILSKAFFIVASVYYNFQLAKQIYRWEAYYFRYIFLNPEFSYISRTLWFVNWIQVILKSPIKSAEQMFQATNTLFSGRTARERSFKRYFFIPRQLNCFQNKYLQNPIIKPIFWS